MRAGDIVKHNPTGEMWTLAYGDEDSGTKHVSACGWPETIADVDDCEVVTAATNARHVETLREAASSSGHRASVAKRILDRMRVL